MTNYATCERDGCDLALDDDPVPDTDCPTCEAGPGERCVRPSGWTVWNDYHQARINKAVRRVCPLDGQPCWQTTDDDDDADTRQQTLDDL